MVILISNFDIIPNQESHFESMWQQAAAALALQHGLLSSRLLRSLQAPSHYTAYTVWDSETDVAMATQNEAYQQVIRKYPLVGPVQQQRFVLRYEVTPPDDPGSEASAA